MFIIARPFALVVTLIALTPPVFAAPTASTDTPAVRGSVPVRSEIPARDRATPVRVVEPQRTAERTSDAKAKVNINTADVKGLMTLTGVSRKVAEKIVAYREGHGAFKKAEEIRKVDGVGNGVWEKNRARIVIK